MNDFIVYKLQILNTLQTEIMTLLPQSLLIYCYYFILFYFCMLSSWQRWLVTIRNKDKNICTGNCILRIFLYKYR